MSGKNYKKYKLGDITKINYGSRITKKNAEVGNIPVYGGGDITFYTRDSNRNGYNIVVSRFGVSEKCVRIINNEFFLNDSGFTIISSNENLDEKFLGYYLLSIQRQIYDICRGTAQKNISIDEFINIEIQIPPLNIQQIIINKLEHIDFTIESEKQQIQSLKQQSKEMFDLILQEPLAEDEQPIIIAKKSKSSSPKSTSRQKPKKEPILSKNVTAEHIKNISSVVELKNIVSQLGLGGINGVVKTSKIKKENLEENKQLIINHLEKKSVSPKRNKEISKKDDVEDENTDEKYEDNDIKTKSSKSDDEVNLEINKDDKKSKSNKDDIKIVNNVKKSKAKYSRKI